LGQKISYKVYVTLCVIPLFVLSGRYPSDVVYMTLLPPPQNSTECLHCNSGQINNVYSKKYTKSITNTVRNKNIKLGLMGFVQN